MKVRWMKYRWFYFLFSALVILPGIYSLVRWGVKPSIDFTGGTLLEIKGEGIEKNQLKGVVEELGLDLISQQKSGDSSWLLRFSELGEDKKEEFFGKLGEVELVRWETLGPTLGKELLWKTTAGVVLAILAILVYLNFQFKDKVFGITAILAMLHDTLILLGSFSLLGHFLGVEVDGLFVTAVLTTLSASVHDTVVVFDRIREVTKLKPRLDVEEISNLAISQTLRRSVNNSLTIIFMLLALVIFGGETTRWFATALLIGTTAGTYSSTFTATPLLVTWKKLFNKRK